MVLKNLHLTHFRNFSNVDLNFPRATILIGKNAQGKTNLLESIYFLATTKSARAERDSQLIKQGESFLRVEGEVGESSELRVKNEELREKEVTKLEIAMEKRNYPGGEEINGVEKRVKVNGVRRRVTDYLGNLVVVYFSPEDINLVTGPPALRRWHIDLTLAPVDKEYKTALNTYHSALVAKNRILKRIKEGLAKLNELDFWTEQLVESGQIITRKRRDFFQNLNNEVSSLQGLAGLIFVYESSEISDARTREYLSREIAAATSLIGPHRDDFIFKREGQDLAYFGSRGEQRTAVLELKLAELKFIQKTTGSEPMLLLDDVFSELDVLHRDYIVSAIVGPQVVISVVETDQIPSMLLKEAKMIKVEKGKILEISQKD